jgi:hypothetical protein
MDRKYAYCEFTNFDDGEPITLDPADIVGWKRAKDQKQEEDVVTQIYTSDGSFWQVSDSYIEVGQVVAAAKTNNLILKNEL